LDTDMKIASATVRRLRTGRGWSQEQLAIASGLSLRTIQRVEAEGAASMATRVCLAATFDVPLADLGDDPADAVAARERPAWHVGGLFVGLAILGCVLLGESGRLPGGPMSTALAAINALLAAVGLLLVVPAAYRLVVQRRHAGVILAALGMPLVTLVVAGLVYGLFAGRMPDGSLAAFGLGGAVLVAMALRQFRAPRPARG
jgi:transcriptional regulator with XRE-family HTH domain